jgi:hypothetical protein
MALANPPYRSILNQWRASGRNGDPHLSEVLDGLSAMVDWTVGEVIRAGELKPYFDTLKTYAYRKLPEQLDIQAGELWVFHYPREINRVTATTANRDGVLVEMSATIAVAAIVGFSEWGVETMMAKSADVGELLQDAYEANATLQRSDGTPLLGLPLIPGRMTFGELNFAGKPIGWGGDVVPTLRWMKKNWWAGK